MDGGVVRLSETEGSDSWYSLDEKDFTGSEIHILLSRQLKVQIAYRCARTKSSTIPFTSSKVLVRDLSEHFGLQSIPLRVRWKARIQARSSPTVEYQQLLLQRRRAGACAYHFSAFTEHHVFPIKISHLTTCLLENQDSTSLACRSAQLPNVSRRSFTGQGVALGRECRDLHDPKNSTSMNYT